MPPERPGNAVFKGIRPLMMSFVLGLDRLRNRRSLVNLKYTAYCTTRTRGSVHAKALFNSRTCTIVPMIPPNSHDGSGPARM